VQNTDTCNLYVGVRTSSRRAASGENSPDRVSASSGDANNPGPSVQAFQQGLRDLGHIEGKNILIEYRYAQGKADRIQSLVVELVNLKVDLLFSTQAIVVRAAKQATQTIPIVMAVTPDPVAAGLVDSLARPGGNVTGLTSLARDLSGKRLELLMEIVPRLTLAGILTVTGFTASKDYEDAARDLKAPLQLLEVQVPNPDLLRVFQVATKERVSAIIVASVPGLSSYRQQIIDHAIRNRLPLMSEIVSYVETGGFAFFGASLLGIECDEVIHSILDVMYAKAPYTVIQRAMHIHPTVTELIPTMLSELKPLV
jgi:putative tryptophan/tyrosine transport system substrate-binding protein